MAVSIGFQGSMNNELVQLSGSRLSSHGTSTIQSQSLLSLPLYASVLSVLMDLPFHQPGLIESDTQTVLHWDQNQAQRAVHSQNRITIPITDLTRPTDLAATLVLVTMISCISAIKSSFTCPVWLSCVNCFLYTAMMFDDLPSGQKVTWNPPPEGMMKVDV